MNLLQLRRAVRSRLGVPTSDQMFTDDILDDHINLALGTVASEHNWPWDEISAYAVAVNGAVTPPDDWRNTRGLFYIAAGGSTTELRNVANTDLLRAGYSPQAESVPQIWAENGGVIYVRPAATGNLALLLDYYREPKRLVEDTDEPYMPRQYRGSIVAKAAQLLSIREDNRAAADAHLAEYTAWLARMRRSLRRSTGPVTPRVREGSWI